MSVCALTETLTTGYFVVLLSSGLFCGLFRRATLPGQFLPLDIVVGVVVRLFDGFILSSAVLEFHPSNLPRSSSVQRSGIMAGLIIFPKLSGTSEIASTPQEIVTLS